MLPFSLGFLAVFLARAPLPAIGLEMAAAALVALAFRLWRAPRPRVDLRRASLVCALCGAAAAWIPPSAAQDRREADAPALDARAHVARVEGTVEPGGRIDARGASFRLQGGPIVRVAGASAIPPPFATIAVAGQLDAARGVVTAASPEAITLVREGPLFSPARLFEGLRTACRERVRASCPPGTASVLLPLLIGDGGLPDELREDLTRTGTLHVLAVSGTHMSLFLAGLHLFTRKLRILIPVLVVYAGMCAFEPPVLRSLVLAIGFSCGRRLGRALPQGSHFLLSAVIVLAFDPGAIFEAGFQLSFSAFGGIIALAPDRRVRDPFDQARERSGWKRALRVLKPAARAGAGATLATAPAMIWRFNRISPVGIPATLLLSPFIPALLWLGALIVLFPSVPAFPKLATALIDVLQIVASWVSAIPFASVDVPRPHACALAAFSGVVLSILLSGEHDWSGVRVAIVAIAVLGVLIADRPGPGLYQLPAGRGAATLLVGREAAVLVDTGPESARVAEQLLKLGVGTLDLVVLTHEHADHTGGLAQVLARVHVLAVAEAWSAGSSFEKADLQLAAVWPPPGLAAGDNDRSVALEARIDGFRALLLGDLERPGLEGLLCTRALEREDAVLLPHHGSENGALCDLLLRTRPSSVILSARAGFPAEETLHLLATLPVEIRATYREGLIALPANVLSPRRTR